MGGWYRFYQRVKKVGWLVGWLVWLGVGYLFSFFMHGIAWQAGDRRDRVFFYLFYFLLFLQKMGILIE